MLVTSSAGPTRTQIFTVSRYTLPKWEGQGRCHRAFARWRYGRLIPLSAQLHREQKTVSLRKSCHCKEPLRHTPRRHPFFAGILLLVFLTVQLAATAYACAGSQYQMGGGEAKATLTESCADMADHGSSKDKDNGALCLAHCQADSKSADHVAPQLPVFLPVLAGVIAPTPVVHADVRAVLRAEVTARAPPPPLAILYCSFQT